MTGVQTCALPISVTLPHARLLALPEVGHVPQIETPVTVARAVLGLWRAVDAGQW